MLCAGETLCYKWTTQCDVTKKTEGCPATLMLGARRRSYVTAVSQLYHKVHHVRTCKLHVIILIYLNRSYFGWHRTPKKHTDLKQLLWHNKIFHMFMLLQKSPNHPNQILKSNFCIIFFWLNKNRIKREDTSKLINKNNISIYYYCCCCYYQQQQKVWIKR